MTPDELRETELIAFREGGLYRLLLNSDTSRESVECAWKTGFSAGFLAGAQHAVEELKSPTK